MSFSVERIEWEYGKEYGHVYYPADITDLQHKVAELDVWGRKHQYPFLVGIHFINSSYIGFTVGHDLSYLEFFSSVSRQLGVINGPYYLVNANGKMDEFVVIYYMASYTEVETAKMLLQAEVLAAVYYYVECYRFPSFIQFDDEEVNDKFVVYQC